MVLTEAVAAALVDDITAVAELAVVEQGIGRHQFDLLVDNSLEFAELREEIYICRRRGSVYREECSYKLDLR